MEVGESSNILLAPLPSLLRHFLGTIRSDCLGNTILTHFCHHYTLPLHLAFPSCYCILPSHFCHFRKSLISIHLAITEQTLDGH